jgi:predicted nucleic acid-binding protein
VIVVDSVGWLAYFTGDHLASSYRSYLYNLSEVLTPSIIIYEVMKRVELTINRRAAAEAVAPMMLTQVVPLDEAIATAAARMSIVHKLPMADAIIYTTARLHDALLITSDVHLKGLPGVEFIPHPNTANQQR